MTAWMQVKSTVPNVWIGGAFVGGADELGEMDRSGQLAAQLRSAA